MRAVHHLSPAATDRASGLRFRASDDLPALARDSKPEPPIEVRPFAIGVILVLTYVALGLSVAAMWGAP